jgi:hypothetical protein
MYPYYHAHICIAIRSMDQDAFYLQTTTMFISTNQRSIAQRAQRPLLNQSDHADDCRVSSPTVPSTRSFDSFCVAIHVAPLHSHHLTTCPRLSKLALHTPRITMKVLMHSQRPHCVHRRHGNLSAMKWYSTAQPFAQTNNVGSAAERSCY